MHDIITDENLSLEIDPRYSLSLEANIHLFVLDRKLEKPEDAEKNGMLLRDKTSTILSAISSEYSLSLMPRELR